MIYFGSKSVRNLILSELVDNRLVGEEVDVFAVVIDVILGRALVHLLLVGRIVRIDALNEILQDFTRKNTLRIQSLLKSFKLS